LSLRLTLSKAWAAALAAGVWWVADTAWALGQVGARIWLPEGVSSVAPAIDRLFYIILWITGVVFVAVEATLLVFLVRYRQRPGRHAAYTHGNSLVETIWTVIPALILVWLAFFNQRVWSQVRGTPPPADLEVEITSEQFAWNIRYPGVDGVFGRTDRALVDQATNPVGLDRSDPQAADDVVTLNQLHLPIQQTVLIHLKSKDVIHSFFVPQFRVKQDVVPGLTGRMWVEATKAGQLEIACAELCGLGHYRMRGFLTLESSEAFQAWLATTAAEQAL
jgi:cytochrome c oxidase subunit 2